MKFNVEVEIAWLDEGGELDQAVKDQIVNGVVGRVSSKYVEGVTEQALTRINDKLDQLVKELFDGFLNKEVTITNQWGDVRRRDVTIDTLLKEKLDKALEEKVSVRDGTTTDYGDKVTRLDYLLNNRVKNAVTTMTKTVVEQVDAKIAETLNATIKAKLGESLLAKVDVDGITKKVLSELGKK